MVFIETGSHQRTLLSDNYQFDRCIFTEDQAQDYGQ